MRARVAEVLPGITAAAMCAVLAAGVAAGAGTRVTCRVDGDPDRRVYVLEKHQGVWRLSFRSVATDEQWVRLTLPGAEPSIAEDGMRLSYRNANGGRQIDLVATPGRSALDVWVDYGLDVNIEPDLDPRVDLMSTEGPLAGVACVPNGEP